ncbi:extracellular solute-binding protein [Salinibacterium sp. SYSU T00001]|uniref:ABC transporter substrate-binding protein n=1 Tax=Homoserinimonas sedimenticola TaxID=2986805 RepID=UPI0022356061|nr:extracellular solute-binding protein [Salinibacterium sedimenticola]MCW4385198.1 extracellular solute-binding protein [Salinibacterium sedimenticola]
MMNRSRYTRAAALGATATLALGLAACSSGGDDGDGVTITWWHNATSDPLQGLWADVAAEFEADHPGVTVEVTGYQNEDLQRTLIPNALQSGDAPDLFMVWPGGEVRSQAEAGHLMDLTDVAADTIDEIGNAVMPWQVDGAQYAIPYAFGATGIWYNKQLFEQAGIEETPETLSELEDAVADLKEIGVAPIAVGAGDLWPAGHWWYQFAISSCSTETLQTAIPELDFSDPCWVEAGERLEDFLAIEPFNEGFLATPAQTGADSSNGLIANGNAAMEFMGPWNAGTIGSLTTDGEVPEWLGWFPFPSIEGAEGDPGIIMGGGDGFGISADAPEETVELLQYIMSEDVQRRFAETGAGIPTHPGAADAVADENLAASAQALAEASYVQLWLDSALGPAFGGPLNQSIVNIFAGSGTPEDVVATLEQTADAQ